MLNFTKIILRNISLKYLKSRANTAHKFLSFLKTRTVFFLSCPTIYNQWSWSSQNYNFFKFVKKIPPEAISLKNDNKVGKKG